MLRFLLLLLFVTNPGENAEISNGVLVRSQCRDALYSDLVVRGYIISVTTELTSVGDAMPWEDIELHQLYTKLAYVKVKIEEVVRGRFDQNEIEFVVYADQSRFRLNYRIGDEMLVGLQWKENVVGGKYVLWSDGARFINIDSNSWQQQSPKQLVFKTNEITNLFVESDPVRLASQSDFIVVGQVAGIRESKLKSEDGETVFFDLVDIEVKEVINGEYAKTIQIRVPTGGDYWPEWRYPKPRSLKIGNVYCVLLKQIGDQYYIHGGVNGVFQVESNRLLFREDTTADFSLSTLRNIKGGGR